MTRTVADRYELGPVIGRGGMAAVHAGRDTRLDRPVAIKLLRGDLAGHRAVRQRFESEARLAARLFHPNVVAVFDSGEAEDGVPFIVMERLSGSTLEDRLRQGTLTLDEAKELASQVLSALEAAHAAGVLHRDVKPANILLGPEGQWKVGDFGIAKALEGSSGAETTVLMGTPAYLSPERLHGSPATVQSDLYSVGVVLYEALTGRKPLETPLLIARPDVHAPFAAAVEQCLSRDPARRPDSASSVQFALAGLAGSGDSAGPAGPVDPAGAAGIVDPAGADPTAIVAQPDPTLFDAAAPPPTDVLPLGATLRHSLSRRTKTLIGGVAALAVALIVIASLPSGHSPTSTTTTTVPAAGVPAGLARALSNLEKEVTP